MVEYNGKSLLIVPIHEPAGWDAIVTKLIQRKVAIVILEPGDNTRYKFTVCLANDGLSFLIIRNNSWGPETISITDNPSCMLLNSLDDMPQVWFLSNNNKHTERVLYAAINHLWKQYWIKKNELEAAGAKRNIHGHVEGYGSNADV